MPTLTKRTAQRYRERAEQILNAANDAAGKKLSPMQLAFAIRSHDLAASSFRQAKAALTFTMEEAARLRPDEAPKLQAAIDLLKRPRSGDKPDPTVLRT